MPQPDYGLDAPKLVRRFSVRGGSLIAFAVVLYFANRVTKIDTLFTPRDGENSLRKGLDAVISKAERLKTG